jgi:cytochrome c peroxidase
MKNKILLFIFIAFAMVIAFSFSSVENENSYFLNYKNKLNSFEKVEVELINQINETDLSSTKKIEEIKSKILSVRTKFKGLDFWFRYLDPLAHKKLNGPLPVEWETEVFEKQEKPYRREGAGYTLALQYLEEENLDKNIILNLVTQSLQATKAYQADSITNELQKHHHFYLCNRLYLLNLATIYTSGFDCPEKENIVPELMAMMKDVNEIYTSFNQSFPDYILNINYINLYNQAIQFVASQPEDYSKFDHYNFIRNFVNPLFAINQQLIINYKVYSKSFVDYSLNKQATSIFSKGLYNGQNIKGIFLRVNDEKVLAEIDKIGKLLFYDPILSGNNERSCASCHKPAQFFTDTVASTSIQYNFKGSLERNSPTLINAIYNHLIMLDGKHINLQNQNKGVITSTKEMGSNEAEVLQKVLSCNEYKTAFTELLKQTPTEKEITMEHLVSAITFYYSKFSKYNSPFDDAMNLKADAAESVQQGFNTFMGKAECATCHFAPQFNGVKPPYVGSEFEVIGVPKDMKYTGISDDKGRYNINPAPETLNAFRTGTIRNAEKTKPYMHNGVFNTMEQVIDFYNTGGGVGNGLHINNQTLSADSLHLTNNEKTNLIAFINSLTEKIPFESAPKKLPKSDNKILNKRKVGGTY